MSEGNPLGDGEKRHPKQANALLVTRSRDGHNVKTRLWLTSINTDLTLDVNPAQVKKGLVYRPLRLQERALTFNAVFTARKINQYELMAKAVRDHWAFNLNSNKNQAIPMQLIYFGANKTFRGFIEGADMHYAYNDVTVERTFRMRLLTQRTQGTKGVKKVTAPYVPTNKDVTDFGPIWFTTKELEAAVASIDSQKSSKKGKKDTSTRPGELGGYRYGDGAGHFYQ